MNSREILENLPHRYPFIMVDRMVELVPREHGIGLKNFTLNEAFFGGHFPGEPIVPGVLVIESLAQTAGLVWLARTDRAGKTPGSPAGAETAATSAITDGATAGGMAPRCFLAEIRALKFKRMITPGEQMTTHVRIMKSFGALAMFEVEARVGNEIVAQGELVMAQRQT
ncbi:MAG: 3-hydroxyacyl-[acyl-carrier-protein] dehydratase FabZ [Planctomycetota bacterium]|nr:3-hydroxyacyl-[acyl-carrier-protein] dehydratase FabZ [Planctomycetota bacterium]